MNCPPNQPCPCRSGKKYKRCCRPAHRGQAPKTPEALMRSRFSAFACGLARYVMETTDPEGTAFEVDAAAWERSILAFSQETRFDGLEILASSEVAADAEEGSVTFKAALTRETGDVSFTEQSRFRRRDGRWLYHSGVIQLA